MQKLFMIYISLALTLILTSCASHQKGNFAYILDGEHPEKLPITAFIDEAKSTKHFKVVNIQFRNESDSWIRVERAQVSKLNNNSIIAVTTGEDLKNWKKSFLEFKNIEDHNEEMSFLGVLATVAAVGAISAASGNGDVASSSVAVMQGAVAVKTVGDVNDSVAENLENAKLKDENYLSTKFSIAPGMVMRKWVLLQVPKDEGIDKLDFEVQYKKGNKVNYNVELAGF